MLFCAGAGYRMGKGGRSGTGALALSLFLVETVA